MAKTVQGRKAKGRKLQQYVAAKVREKFDLEEEDVRSTPMGCPGSDLMMSPKALKAFPYDVEIKNQERLNVWTSYQQSIERCPDHLKPLLVIKRNRTRPLVVIDLDEFMELVE